MSRHTIPITNPPAPVRNFTLMDASFSNIPIIDGQIILEENQRSRFKKLLLFIIIINKTC